MTQVTNQCLILAAGNGSRLVSQSGGVPKPLVPLTDVPLLAHVVLSARDAGVGEFVIVVGYRGAMIRDWFATHWLTGARINWVENSEYENGNGSSVLKARQKLRGPFVLLMAAHIFEPRTSRMLLNQPLGPGEVILATDRKIDSVFDLDDATKVRCEGGRVARYREGAYELQRPGYRHVPVRASAIQRPGHGCKERNVFVVGRHAHLGARSQIKEFDIGDAHWQDVDTPEALAYAERIFDRDFGQTPVAEQLTGA